MSTNKRILVVSGIYPPDIGGPATFIPKFCEYLVSNKFDVKLFSLEDQKVNSRTFEPWNRIFVKRNIWKPFRILKVIFILFKLSLQTDVIYANGLFEEVAVIRMFNKKPKFVAKIVGDPIWERYKNETNGLLSIEEFNQHELPIKYDIQRRLLNWSLKKFDSITCPSVQLKDFVVRWGYNNEVYVIENGVLCREIKEKTAIHDIITVSRLVSWKNLDSLIRAISDTEFSLAICGDGPERSNLESLAKTLNVNVVFLGELHGEDLINAINNSKVFALISSYEGLSFSLLEAMMAGKRILVSDVQGNTSVIQHEKTGLVVDVNDFSALSESIAHLIGNDVLGQLMSENANLVARELYCLDTQLKKHMALCL